MWNLSTFHGIANTNALLCGTMRNCWKIRKTSKIRLYWHFLDYSLYVTQSCRVYELVSWEKLSSFFSFDFTISLWLIIDFSYCFADKLVYQAQSPDEAALVSAARNFGVVFRGRSPNSITIEVSIHLKDSSYLSNPAKNCDFLPAAVFYTRFHLIRE